MEFTASKTAERRIEPAAHHGGAHAENDAGHAGDRDRRKRDANRETCAHENAGKDIAAEIIGTEPEVGGHGAEIIEIDDFTNRMGMR